MSITIAVLLIALLVIGAVAAKRIYDQAMSVRSHLVSSIAEVKVVQSSILAGDLDAASAAASRLGTQTEAAVSSSQGRLWSFAEALPFIGQNLTAVRQVALTTDQLATDVVTPASTINIDAFRPQDGHINLEAISGLSALIDQIDTGISKAVTQLAGIDRNALIDQVSSGLAELDDALASAQPMIEPVRNIIEVLPHALGADGPRTYLLMFQGNSEARSLGGNAAIFIVLRAENGNLSIIDEIASQQFHNAPPTAVTDLDPEATTIYGDKIGRYTADFTMVPDYPEAVRILSAWWEQEQFTPFDAVVSFDPVALSYLLAATGPVQLPTGDLLTSDNAASLLLNEAYFRYSDPIEQNVFFTAAAGAIFEAITSGAFEPTSFATALVQSADEGRLLYWSDDSRETELIAGSRIQGVMPADNSERTVLGVYLNDNTGSKMSYYLDMAVTACQSETEVSGSVTIDSDISADIAAELPRYISGPYFAPGDISTYVVVYGPVGSSLGAISIDGSPANVLATGQHLGRPAVKIEVTNHLVSSREVTFTFKEVSANAAPLGVWHTPMTRPTNVDIGDSCTQ